MLLEAAVDVEVKGVLIVLVEVLPCAVVVGSEDVVSVVVVLLEPDVPVEAVVVGLEVVDDASGVVSEDAVVPSEVVVVLLVAAVVVVSESVVPIAGSAVDVVVVPVVI